MRSLKIYVLFFLVGVGVGVGFAQDPSTTVNDPTEDLFDIETVIGDIISPWGLVFLNDGSMLISDRGGALIIFKDNKKSFVKNTPEVVAKGQGGFLDL